MRYEKEIKEELSVKKSAPLVAITFYSKRTDEKPGYNTGVLSEGNKTDVLRLKDGLELAAKKRGKTPPQVEITLFLIPNWTKGEHYDSPDYLNAKAQMIQDAKKIYGKDIIIHDFLDTQVSEAERNFMIDCQSLGSIADIVKTRTIIDNAGRQCLQTDSNVTWANNNFDKLYELTFESNTDVFNASRCSEVYISAHNKLVFTSSDSKLPSIFAETLVDYCTKYNSDKWHKSEKCNGVYDIAFGEGMCRHGLTYRVRVDDKYNKDKTFDFYPANLQDKRYKLMPLVIACQRESWRKDMPPPDPVVLELTGGLKLPNESKNKPALEIEINGVKYGYFHFKSLVRVFTNVPSWHAEADKAKYSEKTGDFYKGAELARNLFVSQQDIPLCLNILALYYNAVKSAIERKELQEGERALQIISKLIPDTEAGNKLSQELFNCKVVELHTNPIREAILQDTSKHDKINYNVSSLPTFWQQQSIPETTAPEMDSSSSALGSTKG